MSELSYKELQEQGVFDVPYRAFEYMQSQQGEVDKLQTEIDELQARVDEALKLVQKDCIEYGVSDFLEKAMDILKGNKDEN